MSLTVVVAIAILLALINSAWAGGRPKDSKAASVYPASPILRSVLFVGALMFLVLALGFVYKLGLREAWPGALFFFSVSICTIVGWPSTIVVDSQHIEQVRFLRARVVIARTDIASVEYDSRTHNTSVFSTEGDQIVHYRSHVASEDFRKKLAAWHEIVQIR